MFRFEILFIIMFQINKVTLQIETKARFVLRLDDPWIVGFATDLIPHHLDSFTSKNVGTVYRNISIKNCSSLQFSHIERAL